MLRFFAFVGLGISGASLPIVAAPATVEPQQSQPAAIDGAALVAELRRLLAETYVLPETRPKLDAALAAGLASGRYAVSEPTLLTERINEDLKAVAHDKHLSVRYDPRASAGFAAAEKMRRRPQAERGPSADDMAEARRSNHGIVEMSVLPGNVRYINTYGFTWVGPESAAAIDQAMRFLAAGDAAIIDLRENGGGDGEAVKYMISYFLPPNTALVRAEFGEERETRSTVAKLPSERLIGKPLYVLTSEGSASAAEEFAGHIGGFHLGELIGSTTAGAGFHNRFFPLPGGFVASISFGRAVLASTGKDWEGKGIAPTTAVDPDKALKVAQVHAFKALAAKSDDSERKHLLSARAQVMEAELSPVPTVLPLTAYAGKFGERTISVQDGALVYQRNGAPKYVLVPVGPNQFAFASSPLQRLRFVVSGQSVSGFDLLRDDEVSMSAQRTS